MVLFDASSYFRCLPRPFSIKHSRSALRRTWTVASVEDLRVLMDGVTALTLSPPCRSHTQEKTNGIRLRQSSGGPQQMQAPLTHLNAVTGWQQKNKGRLEQSADFLSFSYKLTLWVGDVMWCKHSSSVVSQGLLQCNFVLGLNIQVCIDLDNLRLDWHISSCSKCQHVKKTPPPPQPKINNNKNWKKTHWRCFQFSNFPRNNS